MPVTDFDMKLAATEAQSDQLWAAARSILPVIETYANTGECPPDFPVGQFCAHLVAGHILLALSREGKEKSDVQSETEA